jgi:tRNA (mo5U34)-methyltransferase
MELTSEQIKERVAALGPWFHNLDLRGVATAPDHYLGDYPRQKWRHFAAVVPQDLTGRTVLDIGCNAGFYSLEMKRRGAERVLGIDFDDTYLAQARFAAHMADLDISFAKMSVYDIAALKERFDLVLFMGVLYHLRHPLLALDLIREHVVDDLMLFQSMQRGGSEIAEVKENHNFWNTELFLKPGFPRLHFIEHRYADDPTNWWIPNAACVEAMLRSSGFEILAHPEEEVYLCRAAGRPDGEGAVDPARGDA